MENEPPATLPPPLTPKWLFFAGLAFLAGLAFFAADAGAEAAPNISAAASPAANSRWCRTNPPKNHERHNSGIFAPDGILGAEARILRGTVSRRRLRRRGGRRDTPRSRPHRGRPRPTSAARRRRPAPDAARSVAARRPQPSPDGPTGDPPAGAPGRPGRVATSPGCGPAGSGRGRPGRAAPFRSVRKART